MPPGATPVTTSTTNPNGNPVTDTFDEPIAAENWYATIAAPDTIDQPQAADWLARYQANYHKDPDNYSLTAYDAVLVIVTHGAPDAALAATVAELRALDIVRSVASVLRVEGE